MRRRLTIAVLGLGLLLGALTCDEPAGKKKLTDEPARPKPTPTETAPGEKKIQPPLPAAEAPAATARLAATAEAKNLTSMIDSYFAGHVGRRIYIQVDKPLYKPGETIWIRTWDLRARDLSGKHPTAGIHYQLLSPRGAVVLRKQVQQQEGMASNDFVIPDGVKGGEYKIRALAFDGQQAERPVIVSAYEPPRIKKKLELLRKAYGPGDEVSATIVVERQTGEPLARHPLVGVVLLDGQELPRVKLTTNDKGGGVVRFSLPATIEQGDGLLTVMVEDGGITESVSKSLPIVLKKVRLSLFPEGGQLVAGLPSRVYFEAKNTLGKPADVEGRIVDDHGNAVARFRSHFHGMGRFDLTPATGRTYQAEITRPVGVAERFSLPLAAEKGCVLNSYDDLDGQVKPLRVSVRCSEPQPVTVVGVLRENLIDSATVEVPDGGRPAVVYLESQDAALNRAQGVARVTVFDKDKTPLCERLVYRNRRARLGVKVEPHKKSYAPRDQVTLQVSTTDAEGQPVPAELALSVVDDTVISFADDKEGHLLSRLYLESELPDKVEEPKEYFDLTEKRSAAALDMLMGTRGWRRFEWQRVLSPPAPVASGAAIEGFGRGGGPELQRDGRKRGIAPGPPPKGQVDAVPPRAMQPAMPAMQPPPQPPLAQAAPAPPLLREEAGAEVRAAEPARARPLPPAERARRARRLPAQAPLDGLIDDPVGGLRDRRQANEDRDADKEWKAGADEAAGEGLAAVAGWAVVRVFPAPTYSGDYSGPRTDFRETIHWSPKVATGKDGKAMVSFHLSDAVTSFRVFTEGVARGVAGRDETVFKSSLPFSMSVKLPLEVSAGDRLRLPLTLTNETDKELGVTVEASFGELLQLEDGGSSQPLRLAAGKRQSLVYALKVTGTQGSSAVRIAARAGGLSDEFVRSVTVVPVGFPQEVSLSGEVRDQAAHAVDLGQAVAGTVTASVRFFPSPVSSMVSGLDGMLRQPHGCFEQASSSNYPNVMIMRYLKEHNLEDPQLLQRASGLLEQGYRKLVGYESKERGYEWFGGDPGHEALTAYGLLQFVDMNRAWSQVEQQMVARTAAWLRARRDGKGGYLRNARALDSFGRASPEVTDAYITYSLTEAGFTDGIEPEIAAQARLARTTHDAYLLALATNTLLNVPQRRAEGQAAAARLAKMQGKDGAWTTADHSVTRSSGQNLHIETTALAVMALLKAEGQAGRVREAMQWLNSNRGGFGQWGATQATVLALKAMAAHARASRQTQHPGTVVVKIGDKVIARMDYAAGRREPMEFSDLGQHFTAGNNTLVLSHDGKGSLPYSVAVSYRSEKPASSEACAVSLRTEIARQRVKMGESVRLTATVSNRGADQGQPMTLARVGLPGGLTFQTWQLKELRDKKLIAFYETRPREVILYLRQLKPGETRSIPLDLVATVPGHYTGPASSAYLYYTDDQKVWTDQIPITVEL